MTQMDEMGKRLLWFAGKMHEKLAIPKNQQKGDPRTCSSRYLFELLQKEVDELDAALTMSDVKRNILSGAWKRRIIEESADVANFAMMLADKANEE